MGGGLDVDQELIALFNRLSAFDDESLVLEALADVEDLTGDDDLARRFAPSTVAEVCASMRLRPDAVALQRAGCAAVANLACCGEAPVSAVLSVDGVEVIVAALRAHPTDGECVYRAFDALATLVAASAPARRALGDLGGVEAVMDAMRQHGRNVDVQFGGACTLAGATMDSSANCAVLANGPQLQCMLNCYRNAAESTQKAAGDAESRAEWERVMQWAGIALRNLIRCPGAVTEDQLQKADFGRFGSCVPMDELKWQLKQEKKLALAAERQRALRSRPGTAASATN